MQNVNIQLRLFLLERFLILLNLDNSLFTGMHFKVFLYVLSTRCYCFLIFILGNFFFTYVTHYHTLKTMVCDRKHINNICLPVSSNVSAKKKNLAAPAPSLDRGDSAEKRSSFCCTRWPTHGKPVLGDRLVMYLCTCFWYNE